MAREADDADVMDIVLATELGADAVAAADVHDALFPFEVAEGLTALIPFCWEVVIVACGGFFNSGEVCFGRCAANDYGQMVRRAGSRAESFDFFYKELLEVGLSEESFGLLEEVGLVGRAAAFGDEEEVVFVASNGVEVSLCGEVVARVLFFEHVFCNNLRVAEVSLSVGFVDAFPEVFFVFATRPDVFAFFADDDSSARVLACWELTVGSYDLVEQHGVGYEFVVVAGFRVVKDVAQFLQVGRTEIERDVGEGSFGEKF